MVPEEPIVVAALRVQIRAETVSTKNHLLHILWLQSIWKRLLASFCSSFILVAQKEMQCFQCSKVGHRFPGKQDVGKREHWQFLHKARYEWGTIHGRACQWNPRNSTQCKVDFILYQLGQFFSNKNSSSGSGQWMQSNL